MLHLRGLFRNEREGRSASRPKAPKAGKNGPRCRSWQPNSGCHPPLRPRFQRGSRELRKSLRDRLLVQDRVGRLGFSFMIGTPISCPRSTPCSPPRASGSCARPTGQRRRMHTRSAGSARCPRSVSITSWSSTRRICDMSSSATSRTTMRHARIGGWASRHRSPTRGASLAARSGGGMCSAGSSTSTTARLRSPYPRGDEVFVPHTLPRRDHADHPRGTVPSSSSAPHPPRPATRQRCTRSGPPLTSVAGWRIMKSQRSGSARCCASSAGPTRPRCASQVGSLGYPSSERAAHQLIRRAA